MSRSSGSRTLLLPLFSGWNRRRRDFSVVSAFRYSAVCIAANSVCEILLRMLFHWNPSAAFRGFIDGMDQFQGAEAFPACNSDFPAVENRICHVLQLAPVKFAVGDQAGLPESCMGAAARGIVSVTSVS